MKTWQIVALSVGAVGAVGIIGYAVSRPSTRETVEPLPERTPPSDASSNGAREGNAMERLVTGAFGIAGEVVRANIERDRYNREHRDDNAKRGGDESSDYDPVRALRDKV